jgi:hypothetical protein
MSINLCRFTQYWIGQQAFALFHDKIKLSSIDILCTVPFYLQNCN